MVLFEIRGRTHLSSELTDLPRGKGFTSAYGSSRFCSRGELLAPRSRSVDGLSCRGIALKLLSSSIRAGENRGSVGAPIMFLAGLKFSLGLMTGMFAASGILIAIILVTERVADRRKKQKRVLRRMARQTRDSNRSSRHLFLSIKSPAWIDDPPDRSHRRSEIFGANGEK